jgi:hypothetical protein
MLGLFRGVFLVGCLVAAYFLVEQPSSVRWVPFGVGVGVALAGIAGMRSQRAPRAVGPARGLHEEPVGQALEALMSWVEREPEANPRLDDLSGRIDAEVKPHLRAVEHGLDDLQARIGVKPYAAFMDGYARAERSLNRAWSAAADGFREEARAQLAIADQALRQAREALERAST